MPELFDNRILVVAPDAFVVVNTIIKKYGWISYVAVTFIMSISYIYVGVYYRKCSIDRISKFIPVFITFSYFVDCLVELYEHQYKVTDNETSIDNIIFFIDGVIRVWML